MHGEQNTEVLIVGAGPTGLLTALILAHAGIQVNIIDKEERSAARSYACALHPRALKLLDGFGLIDELLANGRRIETLGFYDGAARRAEIKLVEPGLERPYLLV